ncbi:MAG: hypothetical protein AB1566_13535 [Chloroflexota bacterium]
MKREQKTAKEEKARGWLGSCLIGKNSRQQREAVLIDDMELVIGGDHGVRDIKTTMESGVGS